MAHHVPDGGDLDRPIMAAQADSPTGTVLVVDDEPSIRDLIVAVLQDEGYRAIGAGSGSRALELLPIERPDLIVMDIMMPEMDGREALRRIRTTPNLRHIPVVMMSAAYVPEQIGEEIAAFLPKPFDLDHLLDTIANVLGSGPAWPAALPLGR